MSFCGDTRWFYSLTQGQQHFVKHAREMPWTEFCRSVFLVNEWVLIKNIRKSKLHFLRGKENVLVQIRDCNKNNKVLPGESLAWAELFPGSWQVNADHLWEGVRGRNERMSNHEAVFTSVTVWERFSYWYGLLFGTAMMLWAFKHFWQFCLSMLFIHMICFDSAAHSSSTSCMSYQHHFLLSTSRALSLSLNQLHSLSGPCICYV